MKINDVCAAPKGARLNRRLRVAWKLVHGLGTFFPQSRNCAPNACC
jgi:hypothetical protein